MTDPDKTAQMPEKILQEARVSLNAMKYRMLGDAEDEHDREQISKWAQNIRAALVSQNPPKTEDKKSCASDTGDERAQMPERKYAIGDRVSKTKGSSWQGRVVGFYSTELTPAGYAVESEREPGSVQIYPEAALTAAPVTQAIDNDTRQRVLHEVRELLKCADDSPEGDVWLWEALITVLTAPAPVPLPHPDGENFNTVTVTKNDDGTFGYSSTGSLPDEDFMREAYKQKGFGAPVPQAVDVEANGLLECLERYNSHIVPLLLAAVEDKSKIPLKAIEYAQGLTNSAIEGAKANLLRVAEPENKGQISDGYHTFDELYEHRHILFLNVLMANPDIAWRSKIHADGTMFDGWFIAGLDTALGQATYHLPLRMWGLFDGVKELDRAPEWDGHTSNDVIVRLREHAIHRQTLPTPQPDAAALAEVVEVIAPFVAAHNIAVEEYSDRTRGSLFGAHVGYRLSAGNWADLCDLYENMKAARELLRTRVEKLYTFDRFLRGEKMAEGAVVVAFNEEEAIEKARELFRGDGLYGNFKLRKEPELLRTKGGA